MDPCTKIKGGLCAAFITKGGQKGLDIAEYALKSLEADIVMLEKDKDNLVTKIISVRERLNGDRQF